MAATKPILALNSIRGKSGKDTLIEYIEKEGLKVHRVAFADVLKREVAYALAEDDEEAGLLEALAHSSDKDTPYGNLACEWVGTDGNYHQFLIDRDYDMKAPRSMRWHCQVYGTEYVRQRLGKPNYWLDKGLVEILNGCSDPSVDVVVVTDMRMPNEYAALAKMPNVTLIRLVRTWFQAGTDDVPMHFSDYSLLADPFEALVVNEWGKPEAMIDQVRRFLP